MTFEEMDDRALCSRVTFIIHSTGNDGSLLCAEVFLASRWPWWIRVTGSLVSEI